MSRQHARAGWGLVVLALVGASLVADAPAAAAATTPSPEYQDGVVIVGYEDGTSARVRADAANSVGATATTKLGKNANSLKVRAGSVPDAVKKLSKQRGVRYAQPNYRYQALGTPNDTQWAEQWDMKRINAPTAWNTARGSRSIVVAVLDTGIDSTHADLSPNIWRNPGIGFCPAGTFGYDAAANDCDPKDENGHGTHVAGTIGAVGNNSRGVAGINWATSLMSLKVLDAQGSGYDSDIVEAINWAIAVKRGGVNLKVINASLGGYGPSNAMRDAIDDAGKAGITFVSAAGNETTENDALNGSFPCAFNLPNQICVAAMNKSDQLTSWSNYGRYVDLAAPGLDILSTKKGGGYVSWAGTSMASPHVAGAVALMASYGHCAGMSPSQLKWALSATVVRRGLNVRTGGSLDLSRALNACSAPAFLNPGVMSAGASTNGGFYSDTVAVSDGPGHFSVFGRGWDNQVYMNTFDDRVGNWSGWLSLGGGTLHAPAAASMGGGKIAVFVRGGDGALYTGTVTNGAWSGWSSLGGYLSSAPVAISRYKGRVDVMGLGGDGTLYWQQFKDGSWSGWRGVPGVTLAGPPSLSSWSPTYMRVVARTTDGRLVTNGEQDDRPGLWYGWQTMATGITSNPASVALESPRTLVVASGAGGAPMAWEINAMAISAPKQLTGAIIGSPVLVRTPGRVDLFGRGLDNGLWQQTMYERNMVWSGWRGRGGSHINPPTVVSWSPGRFDVFTRDANTTLIHRWMQE
jgi:subtilisin family serine protease